MGIAFLVGYRFQRGLSEGLFVLSLPAIILVGALLLHDWTANRGYSAYGTEEVQSDASGLPVFIIVFDMLSFEVLRSEEELIDSGRYPHFAALADDSVTFENATTNFFATLIAIPKFVDSLIPLTSSYDLRLYEETAWIERLYSDGCGVQYTCRGARYITLADQLGLVRDLTGKILDEIVQPGRRSAAAPSKLLGAAEVVTATSGGAFWRTEDLFENLREDIDSIKSRGRIHFIHTHLPHDPFTFDPEGRPRNGDYGRFNYDSAVPPEGEAFGLLMNLYEDQIGYADKLLGTILNQLKEEGLYDDSVIIVTSDHGLRSAYPQEAQPITVDSLLTRIPMFIRAPGLAPGISDVDYQHVDFGPTLYDLLGQSPPGNPQPRINFNLEPGVSAFEKERPERRKSFFVEYANQIYWKYERDSRTGVWVIVESRLGEYMVKPIESD